MSSPGGAAWYTAVPLVHYVFRACLHPYPPPNPNPTNPTNLTPTPLPSVLTPLYITQSYLDVFFCVTLFFFVTHRHLATVFVLELGDAPHGLPGLSGHGHAVNLQPHGLAHAQHRRERVKRQAVRVLCFFLVVIVLTHVRLHIQICYRVPVGI